MNKWVVGMPTLGAFSTCMPFSHNNYGELPYDLRGCMVCADLCGGGKEWATWGYKHNNLKKQFISYLRLTSATTSYPYD